MSNNLVGSPYFQTSSSHTTGGFISIKQPSICPLGECYCTAFKALLNRPKTLLCGQMHLCCCLSLAPSTHCHHQALHPKCKYVHRHKLYTQSLSFQIIITSLWTCLTLGYQMICSNQTFANSSHPSSSSCLLSKPRVMWKPEAWKAGFIIDHISEEL